MDRMGHSTTRAAVLYQHQAAGRDQLIAAALGKLAGAELGRTGKATDTKAEGSQMTRRGITADQGRDLGFQGGAGDGNRTRIISLGIILFTAGRTADLGIQRPASDRD
jgi:hypothetical protein